jgi:hypothetical protein
LSIVVALTLGKEARFAECLLDHSAKNLAKGSAGGPFAKCRLVNTWQRGNFFAECIREHSVKVLSPLFGVVTVAFLC